jgi:hypothetical protein
MRPRIVKTVKIAGMATLGIVLILVIWQPVFPSGILIQQMADMIEPEKVSLPLPVVVRFELSGKGGGRHNIIVDKDAVRTHGGETDRVDLILYMDARAFNDLLFSIALGKADDAMFLSLGMSDILRFSGDIEIFKKLFEKENI